MSETTTDPVAEQEAQDESDPVVVAENLRRQLATTERNYAEALAREREKAQRLTETTAKLDTAAADRDMLELSTVTNALEAAQSRAAQLQRDYATAMETGDFAKAGQINVEIARVGARLETLEAGKAQIERDRTQRLRPDQPQASASDPIESDLARRTPAAAAWLRAQTDGSGKPRFYTDQAFQARVIGADSLAVGNGLVRDTPEYFSFIERTVGVGTETEGPRVYRPEQDTARPVPTAAPTRSAGSYRDGQGRQVPGHIPADAVRYARDVLKVDPAEYWKEVQRMDRAGEFKTGNPWRARA